MMSLILIILGIALLWLSMVGIVICMVIVNRALNDLIEEVFGRKDTF